MQIITIDGPASSGKGTVAKILAKKLGFHYLESGVIYRALGLLAIKHQVQYDAVEQLQKLIKNMHLEFTDGRVILNQEEVTDALRDEAVGLAASSVGKLSEVRAELLDFQRKFAKEPGLVTDGRDMGSVVFLSADLKVFLTAKSEIRAKRRFQQLQQMGVVVNFTEILEDIITRDEQDSKRLIAPLKYDASYKLLDNSELTVDLTVAQIINWLKFT
jgi:CMP/dCMP kinase